MTTFMVPTGLLDELISSQLPHYGQGGPIDGLNAWFLAGIQKEPQSPANLYQRGPLTRWFGYAFGDPRIMRDAAIAKLPLQPGDPNPFFPVVDAITREGANTITPSNDMTTPVAVGPVTRDMWRLPEYAMVLALCGGDVIDMPVWFEIDDATDECPFSDSGETWETWGVFGESHKPLPMGNKWYRSNAVGQSGELLRASQWVPVSIASGLKVLSVTEFREIQGNQ